MHTIEYNDNASIEEFVYDTAIATGRGADKAKEWLAKLQNQDIMTVGDLRDLEDDDWTGMGLTVFACRALRNALSGRSRPMNQGNTKTSNGETDAPPQGPEGEVKPSSEP